MVRGEGIFDLDSDPINARPWRGPKSPARVLAIGLQAMGDTGLTLPYLQALRRILPDATLDFLTEWRRPSRAEPVCSCHVGSVGVGSTYLCRHPRGAASRRISAADMNWGMRWHINRSSCVR